MVVFFLRFFLIVSITLLACLILVGSFFESQYEEILGQEHLLSARLLNFHLNTRLCDADQTEWNSFLKEIGQEYAYDIQLVDVDKVSVSQRSDITNNGFSVKVKSSFVKDSVEVLYPSLCTEDILKFVPYLKMNSFDNVLIGVTLGFIFVAFTLAVLMLAWPIIKHINAMVTASLAIAEGKFEVKADERAPAPLNKLASAINFVSMQISQLIQEQEVLTSAVSHELNNPVMRLNFALELAERIENFDDLRFHVLSMKDDVGQLEKLVHEILSYSKFNFYSTRIFPKYIQLSPLIGQVRNSVPLLKRGFTIKIDCDGGLEIFAEEKSLYRVLSNLINNALKYGKSYVLVCAVRYENGVALSVSDDGPGVPEAERDAILQPFYRIDNSRSKETGGSGLGLAIVNKIVSLHGGKMGITSNQYGGATVRIYFPDRPNLE